MSTIAFCKRGGQSGILITNSELRDFSNLAGIALRRNVVPLPDMEIQDQKARIGNCDSNHAAMENTQYWENADNGSHGWCCSHCGEILQWG